MAVQKQIWLSTIVEGLFASNSFLSKAFNADEYVNSGKTVHIPNAGKASNVKKNRTEFPAQVNTREDKDLTFNLDEFTTDPILISHADTVELSYDKRESVLRNDKLKLQDSVALDFIKNWSPSGKSIIKTTGKAQAAHTSKSATGMRKGFTKKDVLSAMVEFNASDIPQEGRYMLLDALMHAQLLNDLTEAEGNAFLASADAQNGIIGKLYGFNIMMRSKAALYDDKGEPKHWNDPASATDCAAALAWHEQSVCRALGEVKMFDGENDPTYYGDIYSFLLRAGGRPMREDVAGLIAIVQDQSA